MKKASMRAVNGQTMAFDPTLDGMSGMFEERQVVDSGELAHCIECGCHDLAACHDEAADGPCAWLVIDRRTGRGVCSACRHALRRWRSGDRAFAVAVERKG